MNRFFLPICAVAAAALSAPIHAEYTRNPVMLVPGILAFDDIAGITYWDKIPDALAEQGVEVYIPQINAFDSSVNRGEQLIAQLEEIKAASNGCIEKFNLVGHSQGGLTSRYVMSVRPDLVASLVTIGSPHAGAPLAEVLTTEAPQDSIQGRLIESMGNALGNLLNILSGNSASKSDVYNMMTEFNQAGSLAFNQQYPAGLPTEACGQGAGIVTLDGHEIPLWSWSGTGVSTNFLDISDPLLKQLSGLFPKDEANDGITGSCSSHFGTVLKDNYNMNHLDQISQVLGLVSLFETNPRTVYKAHATRLKNAGL